MRKISKSIDMIVDSIASTFIDLVNKVVRARMCVYALISMYVSSPSATGPYRQIQLYRTIASAFRPWFESLYLRSEVQGLDLMLKYKKCPQRPLTE